jgi:uncharacterized membrane protein
VLYQKTRSYDTQQEDIFYAYLEGRRILEDQNPYSRVLAGDLVHNDKYPTYLPGFYVLSALVQKVGLRDFPEWMAFWRVAFAGFHWGVGMVLFLLFYRRGYPVVGLVVSAFWLFNRFTILVLRIGHLEPMAVFFLVLSLALLRRWPLAGCVLLSVSLALKQVAVFLVPVYLVWAWQRNEGLPTLRRCRDEFVAAVAILGLPLLLSIPFLLVDSKGYVASLAFSVTRLGGGHFGEDSVDMVMNLVGPAARLPMLALMALTSYGPSTVAASDCSPPASSLWWCSSASTRSCMFSILCGRFRRSQWLCWTTCRIAEGHRYP